MMLLAMGKRRLDPKAHKNANVFCPKSEGEHEAQVFPFSSFFYYCCLQADSWQDRLRFTSETCALSNKISFICWHHLPQGTAGFCQVACLLLLTFLYLITAIAMAGVKRLVKMCGKNKNIQKARETPTIPT